MTSPTTTPSQAHPPASTSPPTDPDLNTLDLDPEQRQKEALAAFTATLHSVGTNLEAPLRERAAIINSNTLALERQEAELAENSAALGRQNDGWERIADETRVGLKEIGDVQNWAEMIERDLLALESMMDEVEGGGAGDGFGFGFGFGWE
ncbi:GCN5-like 1 [Penicillium verhagenii]|nr:GCN5-like 1 [Penicillium verhagenii]